MKGKVYHTKLGPYDITFFLLLFCIVSLFWLFPYPAIVDAPQHATQLRILEQIIQGDPFYEERFWINWFTPYIFPNLILVVVAYLFSPLIAIKSAITFYLVTFSIIGRALVHHFDKPKPTQLLCLCFLYTPALYWGFIPFLVSISIGAIWFYLLITNRIGIKSTISLTFSLLLMFSHAIGWAILTYNVISLHFLKNGFSKKSILNTIPILAPAILIIGWFFYFTSNEVSATEIKGLIYGSPVGKLVTMLFSILGDNIRYLSIIKVLIITIIFSKYIEFIKTKNDVAIIILLNLVLYFALPGIIFSTAYIDIRALPIALLILPLTISKIANVRLFNICAFTMIFISMTSITLNQFTIHREINSYHKATSSIALDSDVFYISKLEDLGDFKLNVQSVPLFIHFPHWLSSSKTINIDYNFSIVHNIMLRTNNKNYPWNGQVSYSYARFQWNSIKTYNYDYIIIRNCNMDEDELSKIVKESSFTALSSVDCWKTFKNPQI
ncbi:hypothetical protein [Vibrio hangzhouensis]|uniref:hypothetical protein n=1 Tax=Vibrio hangzhouensis TaxID=462991 RepID=UPI001C950211|nr:hypothetical protein [Vibrio hangzhouensis]MBY6196607.1 hypothetical protein [Vibrio hangzhouensis]